MDIECEITSCRKNFISPTPMYWSADICSVQTNELWPGTNERKNRWKSTFCCSQQCELSDLIHRKAAHFSLEIHRIWIKWWNPKHTHTHALIGKLSIGRQSLRASIVCTQTPWNGGKYRLLKRAHKQAKPISKLTCFVWKSSAKRDS